jgi:1-acyl-sn-glycerol-3-phosphate acyltransferase
MNPVYFLGHRFFREVSRGLFSLTVLGKEHIDFAGPALITSNHVSYLDPPFIGSAFDEDICFLARKSLFRFAISHWILTRWQAIAVDRDRPDPGSLKTVLRRLKEGKKVIIFPEGTRSPDGSLLPGEPGVGMLIAKAGVPVLPVRIFGAHRALPRDKKLPQPARITIAFGKPWTCDPAMLNDSGKDRYQRIADEVMRRISELQES